MKAWRVVARKELVDAFRDRRSLLSLLLFPLVGPLMVAAALTLTTSKLTEGTSHPVPVVGAERAPDLIGFLEDYGVEIAEPVDDPLTAVAEGDVPTVLLIPADFARRQELGKQVTLDVVVDPSRPESQAAASRLTQLIGARSRSQGALRLLARGVDPAVANPLAARSVDVSTPQKRAALIFGMLPMFVLMASFIGGMYVATDSTAGERERGSLEPLLLTPATRRAIVFGKWVAAACFSVGTVLLTFAATLVALSLVPEGPLGMELTLRPLDVGLVVVTLVPLSGFASAAQLVVASFARSYKEAQTYLSLMIFVPMLPATLSGISPLDAQPWMHPIPILGQQVIVSDLVRGEPVAAAAYVLAALGSVVATGLLLRLGARLLQSERIVMGR